MTKLRKIKSYSLLDNKGYVAGTINNPDAMQLFSFIRYKESHKVGTLLYTDVNNLRNKIISVKNRVYGKSAETVNFTGDNVIIDLKNTLKGIHVSFVTDKVNNINIFIQKKMLSNLRNS